MKIILNDPVAGGAALVILGGVIVLLWALKKWFQVEDQEPVLQETAEESFTTEEEPAPEPEPVNAVPASPSPVESSELIAQLIERLNQMTERVYAIEKREPEQPTVEMAHKLGMIANRLMALETVVQENTPKTGAAGFDKEISMAFKSLTDRIGILEKAIQNLHKQESSSNIKREAI